MKRRMKADNERLLATLEKKNSEVMRYALRENLVQ
jgi:hypothetical protein